MCVAVFQNKTSVKKTYLSEGHRVMGQQVPAPKSTAGIQVSQSQLPTQHATFMGERAHQDCPLFIKPHTAHERKAKHMSFFA